MGPLEMMIRAHLTARGYARTFHLADRFSMPTAQMRRHMLRLEKQGVVKRDEGATAVNDICWVLASPSSSQMETK